MGSYSVAEVTVRINLFRKFLDRIIKEIDIPSRILMDPVEFPHRYKNEKDIEIVAFISSLFSYGSVRLFKPVIERILMNMGRSPYEFIKGFETKRHAPIFKGIYYRFQKEDDILELLRILSLVLRKFGSIERAFMEFYSPSDPDTGKAIEGFSRFILKLSRNNLNGLNQLFPLPSKGSACKRANLFLRWMVRKDCVDFGLWKGIPKNKLIIPLDVHISRIGIRLGLTKRKTPDWKMAVEITEFLKSLDPEDPLRYDFVLCHSGMTGSGNSTPQG
jgi:uncharacterized protein (TIGR02757 family)